MHLQRIELQGFKTFPRRTTIELPPGITAIVGPNGAGKSNLSDAIRWAMGEQTPRHLRIRKAEDVIFAGSEARSRTGMAEVLLTFDNASDWLPTEFDEVVVGRRLFRSGESEYTLNGSRVRLRDIVDLMSAGSASHGGHSVISQGQVDQMLQQRPEDRRAFLEEAAGVARFYTRRDQAQRRLKETHRNLERLRDLVAEIEPRLDILRDQAVVAEQGEELGRELREGQLAVASHRLCIVMEQLDAAESREHEASRSLAVLLANPAEELRRQADAGELRTQALDQELANTRHKINEERRIAADFTAQRAQLSERQTNLQNRHAELTIQHTQLTANAESLEQDAAAAKASFAELQTHLETIRSERLELLDLLGPERELKLQHASISESLTTARDQRVSLVERHRHISNQHETVSAALDRLSKETEAVHRQTDAAKIAADNASNKATKLTASFDDATVAHHAAMIAEQTMQRALTSAEIDLRTANDTIVSLERELDTLRVTHEQTGLTDQIVKKLKNVVDGTVIGRMGDSLTASGPDAAQLLEAAFPDGINTMFVAKPRDGVALGATTAKMNLPQVCWRPAEGFRGWPYEDEPQTPQLTGFLGTLADVVEPTGPGSVLLQRLLQGVLVAEDLDTALQARERHSDISKHVIVTKDGHAIDIDGTVRLSRSGQDGTDLRSRITTTDRALRVEQLKIPELEVAITSAKASLTSANTAFAAAETRLTSSRNEYRAAQKTASEAEHQYNRVAIQLQALEENHQEMQHRLETFEKAIAETHPQIQRSEQDVEHWTKQLAQAGGIDGHALSNNETRLATLEATLAASVERVADSTSQMETRSHAAITVRTEAESTSCLLEKVAEDLIVVAKSLTDLDAESHADYDQAVNETHARAVEEEMLQAKLELQRLQMQAGQRADEQQRAEAAVASAQRETERLSDRRSEIRAQARDELGASDLEPKKLPAPIGHLERRISELRRMLETLGPINPLAPAEYESEQTRVEDAKQQIDDLEGAARNLQTLGQDLQNQLHDEFMTTFDAMNSAFSSIFTDLFGGGEARMELTSPSNIEQTGVEFSVKLPGKRPQELAALSGGERALVAAALILALLRIRPAPFCILDEVDAALDDQNVARFCHQIGELSARTQMMLITHNAVTVEAASTVYGVTMSEDGVSELLSVRLDAMALNGQPANGRTTIPASTNGLHDSPVQSVPG